MKRLSRKMVWWLYLSLVITIVALKFRGSFSELYIKAVSTPLGTNYNLIPFRSIYSQMESLHRQVARLNLMGNTIPFIPFGMLLPLAYPTFESWLRVFEIGILFVVIVEICQFISRLGSFDIDDVILNVFSIMVGYFLYNILKKAKTLINKG